MHYLHECITCCPTPSHAITAADATTPIKAMHQVPLPKEVYIIVPRYYMSLRAKGQAITCHCQATSAAIDPWQKSNSPNFRHYTPLPQVIGCDCPKTLRWLMHHLSLSPAKASHAIASRLTLPLPQCNNYHDLKARYYRYTGDKQTKKKGCLVSWNGANRSSDWWIIGTKQCFQNVAITEVALTIRQQNVKRTTAPSVGRNQKMRTLAERGHFK